MPWSKPQAVELVPDDSALALSVRAPRALLDSINALPYAGALRSIRFFDAYLKDLADLDSLFAAAGATAWPNCRVVSGLLPQGADDFRWIHLIEQTGGATSTALSKAWQGQQRTYAFRSRTVTELRGASAQHFALADFRGVLVASRQSQLVERALSQGLNLQAGFRSESGFRGVWRRTGKGQLTLFAQFGRFAQAMSAFCPMGKTDVSALGTAFSWMGLDLTFSQKGMSFNGVALPSDGWLTTRLLRESVPAQTQMPDILPDNLAVWLYAGLPKSAWGRGSDAFQAYVYPWLGHEAAYVVTEPGSPEIPSYAFMVVQPRDVTEALQRLESAAQQYGSEAPVQHINYMIRRVLSPDLLTGLFPEPLDLVKNPYYTRVGEYIVFANSLDGLKLWIDKFSFDLTLGRNERYIRLRDQLEGRGQGFWYFSPEYAYHLLKRYFKTESQTDFEAAYPQASQLGPIALLLTGQGQRFLCKGALLHTAQRTAGSSISWRASLQAAAVTAPQAFRHGASGRVDIFVQDADNRLYCLGADGSIRWNRPLDSRMFADLQPTDYFGNGEQQYYLNTKKFIYLIDTAGNDVFPPLEVPAEACSGLLLDKRGEAGRLFVGCTNGNVYGYYPNGSALEGWSPMPDIGQLSVAPVGFAYQNKSYVAMLTKDGRLCLAERNGKMKFRNNVGAAFSAFLGADGEIGRLATANGSGVVQALNLGGESFQLSPKVGKNTAVRFAYADVVGDNRKDYVLLSQKNLTVHGYQDKKFQPFQSHTFPEEQSTVFTVRPPYGDKALVGTVSVVQKQVMLFDHNLRPLPGFPLPGTTRFSIADLFGDQGNVLIVANGQVVYAFKLKL